MPPTRTVTQPAPGTVPRFPPQYPEPPEKARSRLEAVTCCPLGSRVPPRQTLTLNRPTAVSHEPRPGCPPLQHPSSRQHPVAHLTLLGRSGSGLRFGGTRLCVSTRRQCDTGEASGPSHGENAKPAPRPLPSSLVAVPSRRRGRGHPTATLSAIVRSSFLLHGHGDPSPGRGKSARGRRNLLGFGETASYRIWALTGEEI